MEPANQPLDAVRVGWLECEEVTCKLQMPLYAQWSPETTEEERRSDKKTWVWDGLTCPEGHSILTPAGWLV
jgi:hypothetical protein